MKDQMLKIAGVKSEKEFYKKFPTEESFMAKHGKKLHKAAMGKSMVNKQLHQLTEWEGVPKAYGGLDVTPIQSYNRINPTPAVSSMEGKLTNPAFQQQAIKNVEGMTPSGGGFDAAGTALAGLNIAGEVIGGIQAMEQQTQNIRKARQASQLSGLAVQAQQTTEKAKRKYVRPEDYLVQPGQLGNPYGSGTNYLAENGRVIRDVIGGNPTEIQNIYNPGDIYTDGGYEPRTSLSLKQYKKGGKLPKAELGEYFQDSGQAQIGSAIGKATGIPGMDLVGRVVGNLLGGAKDARELAKNKAQTELNQQQAAFAQTQQNQFGAYLEDGGKVGDEYKWVSNTWQPQVIAKFGEYNVKDLLKPPHDADMLRSGGHLKDEYYTPPSAEALYTGRPDMPKGQFGLITSPLNMVAAGGLDAIGRKRLKNMLQEAPMLLGAMDNGGRMTSTNMMFDTDKYPRAKDGKESDMNGDLEVIEGGKAETISYNPFLPDGGETVMFKGRSHDNGGIPISFGENGVEVEGGEPAVKLQDGGNASNMVVFGTMKIGLSKAKGKKFKHVAEDISKMENKQNKIIDKATERADMTTGTSGFDQLKLNTSQAQLIGANMKLKNAAILKQNLAAVQNAILDTASELGVKSDKLAEGKIEKENDPRMLAKYGKKLKKAQDGGISETGTDYSDIDFDYTLPEALVSSSKRKLQQQQPILSSSNITGVDIFGNYTGPQEAFVDVNPEGMGFGKKALNAVAQGAGAVGRGLDKYGPTLLSNVAPWLRPRTRLPLDYEQLYPEYLSMATNQLEPVQAQTYQPMLDTPMDISLNDQLNAIDSQSRAAIRAAGNNPSAQAMIMSQSLEAKNKVLGEQTRINMGNKMETYNRNRALLNDAQLRNLQILDQQYVRQAQARSNTKAQALEAMKSIAAKTAQNKLENKTLNVYENMYNYRFSPSGVAYNLNDPYQFNVPNIGNIDKLTTDDKAKIKELYETIVSRDKTGNITGSKEKSRTTKQNRNGSIVKALKNL
jgi:hypothetical protein